MPFRYVCHDFNTRYNAREGKDYFCNIHKDEEMETLGKQVVANGAWLEK